MSLFHAGRRRRFVVAMVSLALVATACGSSSKKPAASSNPTTGDKPAITGVPGVTDTQIRFSGLGTFNSPTGDCYFECFIAGVKAYFAYRNSLGGIYGRDLVVSKSYDDELGKNQQQALAIIGANDSLGVMLAPLVYSGMPDLTKAGYPVYAYLAEPPQAKAKNMFGVPMPSCVNCPHIEDVFAAKAIGATKIAALGLGVSPSSGVCTDTVKTAFDLWGSHAGGAKVVYSNKNLEYGLPNGVAPEATAMIKAGVQLIVTCTESTTAKTVINEMRRQGSKAVLYQVSALNADFIKNNASLYEGSIIGSSVRPAPPEANVDGTDRALVGEWLTKTGHPQVEEMAVNGWTVARLAYEGLKKAGPQLTRQKLIDATNSISRFTAGGIVAPWDIGRQHDVPGPEAKVKMGWDPYCFVLSKIHNGEAEVLKPATKDKPWLCWPGDNLDWSDPVPTTFK